jgi:ferredoxin/flavodoxin---NADP+ reductase
LFEPLTEPRIAGVGKSHNLLIMSTIVKRTRVASGIVEFVVDAPEIAAKAKPGHFVVVMADECGERVPLTIADSSPMRGTITMVLAVIGTSTRKLARLRAGDRLFALLGPLGHASKISTSGTTVMVAGGVGVAPIYPIAKAHHEAGVRVISIQGSRSAELMFWRDRLAAVSDEHVLVTDDGSLGRQGLVTAPLAEVLAERRESITAVYAIGPTPMMKACAATTRRWHTPTVVSLNTIMIDGTGMCGGCRVRVGEQTRFTCVDGPEFDGHLVDWESLLARQKLYAAEEKASLDHHCSLDAAFASLSMPTCPS